MTATTKLEIPDVYRGLFWWLKNQDPPYRYYAYSGGRSSGKSTTVAQSLALRAAREPIKILCAREYQNSLSDSVHALLVSQIEALGIAGYQVTRDYITHRTGSTFFFRGLHANLQSIKSLEGIDVCWVEEAQTLSQDSLDILIPTIRRPSSTLIFTWNPLTTEDVVMRYFKTEASEGIRSQTLYQHTTYKDVWRLLNPTIREMIQAAADSPDFSHIWMGEPRTAAMANQIVSAQALYDARQRAPQPGATTIGVDVARYGTDRTAVCVKTGNQIKELHAWRHASLTESASRIQTLMHRHQPIAVMVDDTGVGGGLTDILRQSSRVIRGVNFASRAQEPAKYPNIASEIWFNFTDQLPELSIHPQLAYWSELLQELTARTYQINARNQRQVESKKRVGKSPDLADAVLLACYQPPALPDYNVEI